MRGPAAFVMRGAIAVGLRDARVHDLGAQHRDADRRVLRRELEVERLGEREHRVLAHHVGRAERRRGQRRHRRGDHDVAFLAVRELERRERAHAVDHAPDVHVEHPRVVGDRRFPGQPGREYARVVAHDVDAPEFLARLAPRARRRRRRPRRRWHREHLATRRAQLLGRRLERGRCTSASTTRMFSFTNARASARPMPLAPPVTTATRPSSFCMAAHCIAGIRAAVSRAESAARANADACASSRAALASSRRAPHSWLADD